MNVSELLSCIEVFKSHIGGDLNGSISLSNEQLAADVTGISHDDRSVNPGDIFVALTGTTFDSHEALGTSRIESAVLTIGEHSSTAGAQPDLVVDDSRAVLGPLSAALERFPSVDMDIVGVTGTNGKTTVSYLYTSIVEFLGRDCFVIGTTGILFNGVKLLDSQTTPDPVSLQKTLARFRDDYVRDGAMEISSHALDQYRALGTEFSAVGFTNFSRDHIDYHKTMEEYFDAKMRLFTRAYSSCAVINMDDPRSSDVIDHAKSQDMRIITVSCTNPDADVFVEVKDITLSGMKLLVTYNLDELEAHNIETSLIGQFNAENIALVLGLAHANGCDRTLSCQALSTPRSVPGRLERIESNEDFAVLVDYAHTPDALERVLNLVKPLAKKTILVFGCGGDRDHEKRSMMGEIASRLSDYAVVTNDNPRSEDPEKIIGEITSAMKSGFTVIMDREDAIKDALHQAEPGDVVIIAGKGHERGQIFSDHTIDFSDSEVARTILNGESR